MRKSSKAKSSPQREARGGPTPTKFVDRSRQIFGASELQLPPTDAQPVRQRYKLGGGC